MTYSVRKLKLIVDDPTGSLRGNMAVAKSFFEAEDDREVGEFRSLMDNEIHYAGFWGVARGHHAALSVYENEQRVLRLMWTTRATAITGNTFKREGYVQFISGGMSSIPGIGNWLTKFTQKRVHESLVIRDGKVVFRDLSFQWGLGVH
ncbi:uncharacterized protein TM35_000122120 [Trypanosoma theileri]|uniref:NTF2-like domain-containing protein n=1 Tax=Trypanosoma theileri TaxID=67003 RepID=A0A1X0NXL6_9TRYP|nr:uncharacterized protein TM35_000122120 [Trypanosoma theileri]ORC89437.1 hypothetical protein TM35_000122120 [Trypanosoma theileri]